MKNQWRVLLLRAQHRAGIYASNHFSQPQFQVHLNPNLQSLRSITSLLHSHSLQNQASLRSTGLLDFLNPINTTTRCFSSETALEQNESDHVVLVADIFSKPRTCDDIKKEIELNNIAINHDMVLKLLWKLGSSPDVARRLFDWVLESDCERLSSKSYNMMLSILGTNGLVNEFWDMVAVMKKKGYGVSKGVRDKVLKSFEESGRNGDIEKLKALFASGSIDNSAEKMCSKISKIVRHDVWSDDVEKNILDLSIAFSSDMITSILDNLGTDPNKALIFFLWLEESGQFKHDGCTYNAMARVLGREDSIDRFWKLVHEMRNKGHEMQSETYVKVLGRFCKRKMIKDAVELYEFAMAGAHKPSPQCCTFLLKKIAVSKQFDMTLLSRVVKVFTGSGNVLTSSTVDSVLKSLTTVGRSWECNKVLKALEDGGVAATGDIQSKIAFLLSASGNEEEASEFINNIEASGSNLDHKAWESLIEGHCRAGNLDKAYHSFQKMVEKEGVTSANHGFDLLMNAYCQENRAIDACKILIQLVREQQLEPWHSTYKSLITKLLVQGGFSDAINILGLMRSHVFPPFIDPFIEHVSKGGTGADAVMFLRGMTSKRFPSTSVFLRMFDAFSKQGKHDEAHNLLSKCPRYIRNNADVLNFFCSMKPKEGNTSGILAS
ncbi:pentatricopeptide repeat-containing protein At3g02490, mitochondrial-like [Neltuma alba]|uniref:pentatricopeptide repeat-containing protein At3g02490, mitochondrial-like n=1 Tax=Neltuma alba TaxID=207710 RepID=UPI0010A42653|nr:pentatricopeptide repeat-containing protein At3g02490, mitochondrial-like [Prosopis alba]